MNDIFRYSVMSHFFDVRHIVLLLMLLPKPDVASEPLYLGSKSTFA